MARRKGSFCCHASSLNRVMAPIAFQPLAARRATLSDTRGHALLSRNLEAEGSMDGLTVTELQSIVAPINFIEPMTEKPYSYNYEPPPGVPPRNTHEETHTVRIYDARAVNDRLSLDREGFVLL